jgi:hypothetical protein
LIASSTSMPRSSTTPSSAPEASAPSTATKPAAEVA